VKRAAAAWSGGIFVPALVLLHRANSRPNFLYRNVIIPTSTKISYQTPKKDHITAKLSGNLIAD
jgi:hypothetical protein